MSECLIDHLGAALVEDKPGQAGWQFVSAQRPDGLARWYGLYCVWQLNTEQAFVLRLGFKIKPEHAMATGEPAKGMTFKLNPWKSI